MSQSHSVCVKGLMVDESQLPGTEDSLSSRLPVLCASENWTHL